MKYEKSLARIMKYKAMFWLRIDQRCAFIATECGSFSADCVGVNEKKIVEVETKISIQDLKADFKKAKHSQYKHSVDYGWSTMWIPTHFYFAVPGKLVEKTKEIIAEKGFEKYGIINGDDWSVVKRADWIHRRDPTTKIKFQIALRMGSELIRFHEGMI